MSISERIKRIRGSLSQAEFGKRIGSSQRAVQGWEAGESAPGANFLERIHRVFGVDIHWLLTGKGNPYIKDKDQAVIVAEDAAPYGHDDRNLDESDIGKTIGELVKILQSGDTSIVNAIISNLNTFSRAIDLNKDVSQLSKKLDDFRGEFKTLKDKFSRIESLFIEELMKKPVDVPERRAINIELGRILGAKLEGDGTQ